MNKIAPYLVIVLFFVLWILFVYPRDEESKDIDVGKELKILHDKIIVERDSMIIVSIEVNQKLKEYEKKYKQQYNRANRLEKRLVLVDYTKQYLDSVADNYTYINRVKTDSLQRP